MNDKERNPSEPPPSAPRGWKAARLFAVLACLPLLSGCFTANTIEAIKNPSSTLRPDFIERLDHAAITPGSNLLICVEARLTNSPKSGQYTMIVPLSEIRSAPTLVFGNDTNQPARGNYEIKRTEIFSGWQIASETGNTPVFVGPPIAAGAHGDELLNESRPLPGTERTIFPLAEGPINEPCLSASTKFIYTDTNRPDAFTAIGVQEARVKSSTWGYYFLIPFAVVLDIATSPFQLILMLWMLALGPMC